MISSAPSAAREKPFVSGRNSVKQAGGHTDLGATDSPLRDGFRSPQLAGLNQGGDRPTSMRLGCEPVGGVRPGIRSVATQEAVTAWPVRLKRLPWPGRRYRVSSAVDHFDPIHRSEAPTTKLL